MWSGGLFPLAGSSSTHPACWICLLSLSQTLLFPHLILCLIPLSRLGRCFCSVLFCSVPVLSCPVLSCHLDPTTLLYNTYNQSPQT